MNDSPSVARHDIDGVTYTDIYGAAKMLGYNAGSLRNMRLYGTEHVRSETVVGRVLYPLDALESYVAKKAS